MTANAPSKTTSSVKSRAFVLVKVAVAAVLIGWLIRSGALDFGALAVFVQKPWLLAFDLGLFALSVATATLRWRALLAIPGVRVPLARLTQLQLTAMFFNVVIPGSVGGDVVKALYVARDSAPEKRTTILLIVFVERLLGLAALVAVASIVTIVRARELFADPLLRPVASAVLLLGVGVIVGPVVFILLMRRAGHHLERWIGGTTKIGKILGQLVAAMRLLASSPKNLVEAMALSMAQHAFAIGLFTVLTRVVTNQDVAYSAVATVFPLGLLTMILPISPAGLGVGHVAFDRLFAAIGLHGGATVFNVYLLGQMVPCLLGAIPYLALRKKGELPTTEPAVEPRVALVGGSAPLDSSGLEPPP